MKFYDLMNVINLFNPLHLQPEFANELGKILNISNLEKLQRIHELSVITNSDAQAQSFTLVNKPLQKDDVLFLNKMKKSIQSILANRNFNNSDCLEKQVSNRSLNALLYQLLIDIIELRPKNLTKTRKNFLDNTKKHFIVCPLTHEPIKSGMDSIALSSGYIYNLDNLIEWFQATNNMICPVTKNKLTTFDAKSIFERVHQNANASEEIKALAAGLSSRQPGNEKHQAENKSNKLTEQNPVKKKKRSNHFTFSFCARNNAYKEQIHEEPNLLVVNRRRGFCNII